MNKPIDTAVLQASTEVGSGRPHESATLHVTGRATYIDDQPELAGTLHAALGLSPVAHGKLLGIDLDLLRAQPGVVAVLTAADIPGANDCGPIVHDDPILCDGTLNYLGQPVFAVIATTRRAARTAAAMAKKVIRFEALTPALDPREAHRLQQYVLPPSHLTRGFPHAAIQASKHRLTGSLHVGGQEQFYLEGQISSAAPTDDGGIRLQCSTQHPSEMQMVVAHALHLPVHKVQVECRRMGGGFGGKESQSAVFACIAAVAAAQLQRPVKLRPDRDDDFMVTGRRHGFDYDYEVGFDDQGRLLGLELVMITNAGCTADLTGPVMTRAVCHVDNAYWLPNVAIHGYCARTNTQSNTAFRGFGGPQGAIVTELIVERVARHLGLDPAAVRKANYYGTEEATGRPELPAPPRGADADKRPGGTALKRNVTPYLQTVEDNVMPALHDELLQSCDYAARRAAVAAFNAASPVLKKGLAFNPVKFGISFNVNHFNQAGALVHVYQDGSVLVNHGGTEMGQGLNTKVAQVVAQELGVPFERVRVSATDTSKVANTSATAASTGSDLNGKAAQDAARQIRERLARLAAQKHGGSAESVRFADGLVWVNGQKLAFCDLVTQAYIARVQLWSDGFYATPGLHWDRETLTGRPFYYFAYGGAVSEVLIDTLTGEWRLLRADLLHDVGQSLNPAIDVGQVEGGFVQGMGWLTTEELVWHPVTGALLTHAPSTYKIPTANDVPVALHTKLFANRNVEDSIHRSKAVGEPPLLLAFSVWLAIRDAVVHGRLAAGLSGDAELQAPATPEAILRALGTLG
jgi:xanthine dehydrogenase large subunit